MLQEFRAPTELCSPPPNGPELSATQRTSAETSWVGDVPCWTKLCGAGQDVWPESCCNLSGGGGGGGGGKCFNTSVPQHVGACACTCTSGWTGALCSGRAPHVLAVLALPGAALRAWILGGKTHFAAVIARAISAPSAAAVEINFVTETSLASRARTATNTASAALHVAARSAQIRAAAATDTPELVVEFRVLAATTDDGLRMASVLARLSQARVLGDMLAAKGLGWAAELPVTPAVYDARGERVCDSVLASCAEPTSPTVKGAAVADVGGGAVTVVAAAAGSVAALLVVLTGVAAVRNGGASCLIRRARCTVPAKRDKAVTGLPGRRRPQSSLSELVFVDEDSSGGDDNDADTSHTTTGKATRPVNVHVAAAKAHHRPASPTPPPAARNTRAALEALQAVPYWTAQTSVGLEQQVRVTTPSGSTDPGSQSPQARSAPLGSSTQSGTPPALSRAAMNRLVANAARAAEEAAERDDMGAWALQPSIKVMFHHNNTFTTENGPTASHAGDNESTSALSHSLSLLVRSTEARDTTARAMEVVLPAAAWASPFHYPDSGPEDSDHDGDAAAEESACRGRTPAPSLAASAAPSFVPSSLSAAGRMAGVRTPLEELRSRSRSRSRGRTPSRCRLRLASDCGGSDSDGPNSPGQSRPATPSRPGSGLRWANSAGPGLCNLAGPARSATPARSFSPARSIVTGQQWHANEKTADSEGRSSADTWPFQLHQLKPSQFLQEAEDTSQSWTGPFNQDPSSWLIESSPADYACSAEKFSVISSTQALAPSQLLQLSQLPVCTAWVAEGSAPATHALPASLQPLSTPPYAAPECCGEEGVKLHKQNTVSFLKTEPNRSGSRMLGRRSIDMLSGKGASMTPPPNSSIVDRVELVNDSQPASSAPAGVWAAEMHLSCPTGGTASGQDGNPGREGSATSSMGIGGGGMRRRQPPLLV
jgi:hypothetical protein